ncbi:MAG: MFS transporter [Pseudomonadota bacterium]|nr:MFS transporter [Pseudomonadota bacterium]
MQSELFQNRNFTWYLAGNTVSLHGQWMHRVALGWLTWQLTASELWIGIIAATEFMPTMFLSPLFGVMADRFDRRTMALASVATSIILAALLAGFTALDMMNIRILWCLVLTLGLINAIFQPVRMSIIPSLVKREYLTQAVAFQSISFNVSRFVGPALAGPIIAFWGLAAAFALNAISYLVLAAVLLFVQFKTARSGSNQGDFLTDFRNGIRYTARHTTIGPQLMLVGVNSTLGRGIVPSMLPAFAGAIFAGDSTVLATLTSVSGAGAIIGGFWLSRERSTLRLRTITHWSLILTGVLLSVLGFTESYPVGIAVVAALGFTISLSGIGSTSMIQTTVAEEMRGRVLSFWGVLALAAPAFGTLLIGAAASHIGLSRTTTVCGFLCVLLALLLLRRIKTRKHDIFASTKT